MLAIAAFAPSLAYNAALAPVVRPALAPRAVAPVAQLDQAAGFEKGMANFQADFPWLAKYGFGPTVKAERWNGRHAMFGWLAIFATGYADAHGLFPNGATPLEYKDWGALT